MSCINPSPIYLSHVKQGVSTVSQQGDGNSIGLDWYEAFPTSNVYTVLYNIYFSSLISDVWKEGIKYVSIDGNLSTIITDFTPGDTYYFSVRATSQDLSYFDPNLFQDGPNGLKIYPETLLISDVSDIDMIIPILDINLFPPKGIIQIGTEIINYSAKDVPNNSLIVSERGFLNTNIRLHTTDGYDGYYQQSPIIKFFSGFEEQNTVIHQGTCKFDYPNNAYTVADGYKQMKDMVNTDLSADNALQIGFQPYDYVGWHRTDPVSLFNGSCVGTYIGGVQFCADGYGVGFQTRGVPFNEVNDQRQEMLLDLDGEPCVLLQRRVTGTTCSCYESLKQNPGFRCPKGCFSTGIVGGYDQYYFPRRSDGRIMVRFDPTEENIKIDEDGLEGEFLPNCWTLTVPALKSRDVLIRFNEDGTEEYRYKILKVTRNKLLSSISGAQKFGLVRVRKTDPIYQIKSFRDTATMPQTLSTGISLTGAILPHTHNFVISEKIIAAGQINQMTSVSQGHQHEIRNGVVMSALNHTHTLIIP